MRYIINNGSIDMGITPIENIFLDSYLSMCNENQLKVYLCLNRLAKSLNEEADEEYISKFLGIELEEVKLALDFWIDEEILEKRLIDGKISYILKNISLLHLGIEEYPDENSKIKDDSKSLYNDDIDLDVLTKDIFLDKQKKDIKRHEMFEAISEYIALAANIKVYEIRPNEINTINELIDKYDLDYEFFEYAFPLASSTNEKKSTNISYICGTIENWVVHEKIRTAEELDKYLLDFEKQSKKISKPKKSKARITNKNKMTPEQRMEFIKKKMQRTTLSEDFEDEY